MSKLSVFSAILFTILLFTSGFYVAIELPDNGKSEVERIIVEELNQLRANNGVSELSVNQEMVQLARYKSDKMVRLNYIAHNSPDGESLSDRVEKFDTECAPVGENLAQTHYNKTVNVNYGGFDKYTTEEQLAKGVVKQFKASPEHKQNLLDERWDAIGVDVEFTENNKVYVTQNFCDT